MKEDSLESVTKASNATKLPYNRDVWQKSEEKIDEIISYSTSSLTKMNLRMN